MHQPPLPFPTGTFLGFDYGTKYTGIAIGQTITQTATPLQSLRSHQGKPDWPAIKQLIKQWRPHGLVVGLALQPDGSESVLSLAARNFATMLNQRFQLPVFFSHERLTTVAASWLKPTSS